MEHAPDVFCDMRKWPARPHYRFHAERLGEDEHGIWLGLRPGTPLSGPRGDQIVRHACATLVPRHEWFVATWYDPYVPSGEGDLFIDVALYVDIATPAEWLSRTHVTTVDLDLDIVRRRNGELYVDDEDEFAEHHVSYGYPEEIVEGALRSSQQVLEMVRMGAEPFGSAYRSWLARVLPETGPA
jgi:uncharacterized protein